MAAKAPALRSDYDRVLRKALKSAWGKHVVAVADQAIVSGTSFLALILVGRWSSASELGIYALGLSLLIALIGIQESLISLPYAVHRHQPSRSPAEHAGSSLVLSVMLSAVAAMLLSMAVGVAWLADVGRELLPMLCILAIVTPLALLREFARGFAFAHLHVWQALVLDASVSGIQLAALAWLAWTQQMSAGAAFLAIGAACAVAGVGWLWHVRATIAIRQDLVWDAMKRSWELGKWLFANQVTFFLQRHAIVWLLPIIIGLKATGVFAACISIASLANPFTLALANIRTARHVAAYKEGGARLCAGRPFMTS